MNDGPWRIVITPRAEKELKALSSDNQTRVRVALDRFATSSQRTGRRKLEARGGEWRLRVGNIRVLYRPDNESRTYVVLRVLPRGRAYRD